jgi:hypothetical protein
MEGIKEIIASLEQVLEQLRAVAPEEETEDAEPELAEESESAPPVKSEDDSFSKKKPMLVAMLKRNLK